MTGKRSRVALLLAALFAFAPLGAAKERVGAAVFARGAATASLGDEIRLVGPATPIHEHEVLTTGKDSFVIVEFDDGTEMTLRPNTVFRIDDYADRDGEESMRFNLFKGGVRTISGRVAEREPEAFELRTPVATLALRGTDFSARLCAQDCVEESVKLGEDAGGGPDVIGRVAFVKGELVAQSLFGKSRTLPVGGPLFQGDTLATGPGAFAVLAFRDESRITLLENTRFRVDRHEYDAEKPENSSALMRLVRGGIRAVAGLISRARPEAYKIATPVATISTRGTRFDLVCAGDCAEAAQDHAASLSMAERALATLLEGLVPGARAQAERLNGLFLLVRFGVVASESPAGTFEFGAGTTAFITSAGAAPRIDVPLPSALESFLRQGPAPEDVEVPPDLLRDGSRAVEEGDLAVAVYDGSVTATPTADPGTSLDLAEGDAGLLGETGAERLEGGVPAFVTEDPYNFSPDVEVGDDGTIEGDLPALDDEDALSCRM